MPRRALLLAVAAILVGACTTDATTDPLVGSAPGPAPRAATAAAAATALPFRGSVTADETGQFQPPNLVHSQDVGTGNATHLGRFAWFSTFTIVQGGDGIGRATGTAVLTAANGDQLFATFTGVGMLVNGVADVHEAYVITGGTGRFADASGSFAMARSVAIATTGVSTGSFTGTISLGK